MTGSGERTASTDRVLNRWADVVEDMETRAELFEERDWTALQVHPGDITVLTGTETDRFGFDLLVPDTEYEALETKIEAEVDLDEYSVFRGREKGIVFLIVAMEDPDEQVAVLYPIYYEPDDPDVSVVFSAADRRGELHTYLRRLSGEYVEFTYAEPELFEPPETE